MLRDILYAIVALFIVIPTLEWLHYRIEFLKYPSYVKFKDYLRRRNKTWILTFELLLKLLGIVLLAVSAPYIVKVMLT